MSVNIRAFFDEATFTVSYLVWDLLDSQLGRHLGAQIISLGVALAAGALAYMAVARLLRMPEVEQMLRLVRRRRAA